MSRRLILLHRQAFYGGVVQHGLDRAELPTTLMTAIGHIHLAFSLHELKRTKEAYDILILVVDQFPGEWVMRFNLACYSCQLGNLKESMEWLEKAIDLSGKKDIRLMALEDPDLKPLWAQIGEI